MKKFILVEHNERTIKIVDNGDNTCTVLKANKRASPSNGFDFCYAPYSSAQEILSEESGLGLLEWIDRRLFDISCPSLGCRKLKSKNKPHALCY